MILTRQRERERGGEREREGERGREREREREGGRGREMEREKMEKGGGGGGREEGGGERVKEGGKVREKAMIAFTRNCLCFPPLSL